MTNNEFKHIKHSINGKDQHGYTKIHDQIIWSERAGVSGWDDTGNYKRVSILAKIGKSGENINYGRKKTGMNLD